MDSSLINDRTDRSFFREKETEEPPDGELLSVAIPDCGRGQSVYSYISKVHVEPGTRVQVPFGMRQVVGIVVQSQGHTWQQSNKVFKLKPIAKILDSKPLFDQGMLALANWLSRYYMHPLGQVLQAMVPLGIAKKTSQHLRLTPKGYLKVHEKKEPECSFLYAIFRDPCLDPLLVDETKGEKDTSKCQDLPDLAMGTLARRLKKLLLEKSSDPEFYGWDFFPGIARSLQGVQALSQAEIKNAAKRLARKGLVTQIKKTEKVARAKSEFKEFLAAKGGGTDIKPVLTSDQLAVVSKILSEGLGVSNEGFLEGKALRKSHLTFLLHGITGSGKTEVYLNLIEEILKHRADDSKEGTSYQVLVMVPEISLTPQMTYLFEARFPSRIAVVHSAMSHSHRWHELEKIAQGRAQILIGPRSAVLSRFQNLALIIVDEEHDQSYKQENGLRYHARDVAVVRGQLAKIPVVLGSATPSLESYHNALDGRYVLCRLGERIGTRKLPEIEVLEKDGIPKNSILSDVGFSNSLSGTCVRGSERSIKIDEMFMHPQVISSIEQTLRCKEQVIVLVNRRGFAHFLKTQSTGEVIRCSQCSITMTFHRARGILQCHYCNEKKALQTLMEENPHEEFIAVGDGSQKVEQTLINLFPSARMARVDSDTMTGKSIGETIDLFRRKSLDILVGTQMLAKGHDFPDVTLVVLLNVDRALNFPDFRAGERAFQLIVQASGRAGRGSRPGKVLLQLDSAQHPVIKAAMTHDYSSFSAYELAQRKAIFYPPFSRMINFCFSSEDQALLGRTMAQVAEQLEGYVATRSEYQNIRVLGPAVPGLEKIKDFFRQMIILTAPASDVKQLRLLGDHLARAFQILPRGVEYRIDVDPQNLM